MRTPLLPLLGILLFIGCQKQDKLNEKSNKTEETKLMRCGTPEMLEMEIRKNPERRLSLEKLERETQTYLSREGRLSCPKYNGTLYVSVVVHIVLKDPYLVSDPLIESQIAVLNKDFKKMNTELNSASVNLAGYDYNNVANCNIQFNLARIVRKATTASSFTMASNGVKMSLQDGSDPVTPETRLNIWVCTLADIGLKGYAQFPGNDVLTDGVVIDARCFGTSEAFADPSQSFLDPRFNLGRTTTHEIGHWLNLHHIWGDAYCGNDLVKDTPEHEGPNSGCFPDEPILYSNCYNKKKVVMWMNYMDYTNDACMYMFTKDQKARMDVAICQRSAYFSKTPEDPSIVKDVDGNIYNIILLGTQEWMGENLKTTRYKTGDFISYVPSPIEWAALNMGGWCYYNNDLVNGDIYGLLYNWYAVNDSKGLAPAGWHVATETDWSILSLYLGGDAIAGGKMKTTGTIEAGTGLWHQPNSGATNSSGFTALPGDTRNPDGTFTGVFGNVGLWWASNEPSPGFGRYWVMRYDGGDLGRSQNPQGMGMSVRCVKD